MLSTDLGLLISASNSKAKLMTWFRSRDNFSFISLEDTQLPPAQMPKSLNLMNCPSRGIHKSTSVILALGSVDSRVHLKLFNRKQDEKEFGFLTSTPIGFLAGHEDWVTCLSEPFYLQHNEDSSSSSVLYFASGSQDSKIRIWKITSSSSYSTETCPPSRALEESHDIDEQDEPDEDEAEDEDVSKMPVGIVSEENTGEARCAFLAIQSSTSRTVDTNDRELVLYSVTLETLLIGHEDWITSLHWMIPNSTQSQESSLRLFSTSMDRNMVVWSPDPIDGIWSPTIRIGDIGGNLGGSVGGNLLGFVGGCTMVTPGSESDESTHDLVESILGIGFGGSFHLWKRSLRSDEEGGGVEGTGFSDSTLWRPRKFLTGHFDAVTDVIWSNCPDDTSSQTNNEFIITVSADQTCRLFSPIIKSITREGGATSSSQMISWSELSRPQVSFSLLTVVILSSFGLRSMAITSPVFV
jgi:elongator complex protein 2